MSNYGIPPAGSMADAIASYLVMTIDDNQKVARMSFFMYDLLNDYGIDPYTIGKPIGDRSHDNI